MAYLEAQYMVLTGTPRIPEIEMILTMLPLFCFYIIGRNPLTKAIWDIQFTFIMYVATEKSIFLNSSLWDKPPLLNRISMRSVSLYSWAFFKHSSGFDKSMTNVRTLDGSLDSLLTLSNSSYFLAAMTTVFAPSSIMLLQIYSPIPLLPPVMKTTFPLKSSLTSFHWMKLIIYITI